MKRIQLCCLAHYLHFDKPASLGKILDIRHSSFGTTISQSAFKFEIGERAGATPAARNEAFMTSSGRYESSEGSNIGTAITFLLIGLGAGALVGLLMAPKTGKQLRRDLQRGYEDAKDSLGEWAEEAKDRAREVSDRVRDAANRGIEIAEDLRDRAEPLRRVIRKS